MAFTYHKLIRDKIITTFSKWGKRFVVHQATTDEEYWMKLKQKLQEEINKFGDDPSVDTIADVYEILAAICDFKNFDDREIGAVRENKRIEFGGFNDRTVLDESEVELEKIYKKQ